MRARFRAGEPGEWRLESRLALVRATHLNDYISVLRDIGAPVDRELARSKLPSHLEETPDLYVSIHVALDWTARTGRDLHPMDLGLRGAAKASLSSLRPAQQAAIMTAPTGLKRLHALANLSRYEDSALEMSIQHEADDLRVICNMAGLGRHSNLCLAEWLNLQAVISVVRSVAGPSWSPREIGFVSYRQPTDAVRAAFPNTRILIGQPHTSVIVARADLARSPPEANASAHNQLDRTAPGREEKGHPEDWEFVSLLRKLVQPYLNEGRPDVAFAAEMAGISTRTLQRRLKLSDNSYSQILQEARFELARARLGDPAMKVIDVAMMAGYESPQHFTRAFRRFTGVTPSEYRRHCCADDTRAKKTGSF
jgi:AraC-like DNA-binding protein